MKWRPIETAPKDGSAILLWDPRRAYEVCVGDWQRMDYCFGKPRFKWIVCGSYNFNDDGSQTWEEINPTHWMPLPEPPK